MEAITFTDWLAERNKADTCPWAGPRPLSGDELGDQDQLVGRQTDIDDLLRLVRTNSLVRLDAESGVGKTSLVRVGLIPSLVEEGFKPFYCDTLAASGGGDVDTRLRVALEGQVALDAGPVAEQLHQRFGAIGVLILDQFEELIRYDAGLFDQVSTWVAKALQSYEIRIVISLRSEYAHRLRKLERDLNPWVDVAPKALLPIDNAADVEVLLRAPFGQDGSRSILQAETEARIVALWSGHGLGSQPTGMLQLHSLLYALHGRSTDTDGLVTPAMLEDLEGLADNRRNVFDVAMAETVQRKMDLCEEALDQNDIDPYLMHGARRMVRRGVRYLSSGGYKVIQEEHELLLRTLEPELEVLHVEGASTPVAASNGLEEAFRSLMRGSGRAAFDPLTAEWEAFAPTAVVGAKLDGQPWELDEGGRTSGPMLGLDPCLVALEEVRRFAFGLHWLKASHLVRTTKTGDGMAMVSLVHDGFGAALESWAASVVAGPGDEIYRLTAAKGELFDWRRADGELWRELDDSRVVNVRWQHGIIRGRFRRVVFVNCDLRGTRFEDCDFEGVVFLNCLMDAVTISDCRIHGEVPTYGEPYPRGIPPSFEISFANERRVVERLERYRGGRSATAGPDRLISHTSGMPAVPASSDQVAVFSMNPAGHRPADGLPALLAWPEPTGGLAMYGGRLCSLMVRRCTFVNEGQIGLRLVSGTALDVVECIEGTVSIDIFGSVIRGLTITAPVGNGSGPACEIDLSPRDSVLAETWIGPGVQGAFAAADSLLWQLVNLSDSLEATFALCPAFGLVNTGGSVGTISLDDGFQATGLADAENARATAAPMDYQSDPARGEFERRKADIPDLAWPNLGTLGVAGSA